MVHKAIAWWRYLNTRFMIVVVLPLTLLQCYVLWRLLDVSIDRHLFVVGYLTYLGYFLLLRFFDDVKDLEHDNQYYPNRPIQQNIISLLDLKRAELFIILSIFLLNLYFASTIAWWWLLLTSFYFWLTRREFFIRGWLRPRLLLYTLFHQVSVVLILIYLAALWDGLAAPHVTVLVVLNWLIILFMELGRKIRSTQEEPVGAVDTYSAYLGRGWAVITWIGLAVLILMASKGWHTSSIWLGLLILIGASYYLLSDSKQSSATLAVVTVVFVVLVESLLII